MMPQDIILENHNLTPSTTNNSFSLEEAKTLGDEYGELMILPTLSQTQEDRIDEILHLATVHENVDFWVSRAACNRGAELGLLSPEALAHSEDQRPILREHIDFKTPLEPAAETILKKQVRKAREDAITKICVAADGPNIVPSVQSRIDQTRNLG